MATVDAAVQPPPTPGGPPPTRQWNWHPDLPIENSPLLAWPPRPVAAAEYLARSAFFAVDRAVYLLLAILTWLVLRDGLADGGLGLGWVVQVYLPNLIAMILVAGGLHLYFYRYARQGQHLKFDSASLDRDHPRYTFRDQALDNMFWTLASGVTVWTAYELWVLWGFAGGSIPVLSFRDHPVWFVLWFPLIIAWYSIHFYAVHRLLHTRALYRPVHSLHHRNVTTGPWSGISMHPVEHVLYFSSLLIHFVVPSHPVHLFFHMYWLALGAATSHTGFDAIVLNRKRLLVIGDFHHQLHHRHFRCNYGSADVPCDAWAGSFHDGTPEATTRLGSEKTKANS